MKALFVICHRYLLMKKSFPVKVKHFQNYFSSKHHNIKFNCRTGRKSSLISHENRKFTTSVYHKPNFVLLTIISTVLLQSNTEST